MEIVLVGLSHRTASVEIRERVAFSAEQARRAAEELRTRGILEESLVLSTCNRSEIYGVPPENAGDSASAVTEFLRSFHALRPEELDGSIYRHYDREVVRHLFRVAGGLDSMMLGEAEILGQVRESYRQAYELGATGPVLNRLFQGALEVGKRIRTETELGARPMSVATAGVRLAESIFGKLRQRTALVLGAGSMSDQVAGQLRERGIAHLYIANRSREPAAELAERVGGEVVPWESIEKHFEAPDIVVTSVGAAEHVLTRAHLEQAMAARGNRALFLIDLGVPRNIDASVSDLYNVYLFNIDDLTRIVEQNRRARESEIPRAEAIVQEHVEKFLSWQASVEAVALLEALRAKLEDERKALIRDRLDGMPHLGPDDRRRVEAAVEELLERLILHPAERLRSEHELRRKIQNVQALRDFFGLSREKP
jgi:glutamyl-tRNA reductase